MATLVALVALQAVSGVVIALAYLLITAAI